MRIKFAKPSTKLIPFFIFIVAFVSKELLKRLQNIKSKKDMGELFSAYFFCLADMFMGIFYCISIKKSSTENKKPEAKYRISNDDNNELIYNSDMLPKNKYILTFILGFIDIAAQSMSFIHKAVAPIIYESEKDGTHQEYKVVSSKYLGFIMVADSFSLYLFCAVFLKITFYRHHYLSFLLIIFAFLLLVGTIFFSSQETYIKIIVCKVGLKMLSRILYSLENVLGKVIMVRKFLDSYGLQFFKSLGELMLLVVLSIFAIIFRKEEFHFFDSENKNIPISAILFVAIFILSIVMNGCLWFIIYKLTPQHLTILTAISFCFDFAFAFVFDRNEFRLNDKLLPFFIVLVVLAFLILIISALIYNEAIILRCCGFDENTRENIILKSEIDKLECSDKKLSFCLTTSDDGVSDNPAIEMSQNIVS